MSRFFFLVLSSFVVISAAPAQSTLHTLDGDSPGDHFGRSVSFLGDLDGDGHPDFVVGASEDSNVGLFSGSARVFSGKEGRILFTLNGDAAVARFGWSVSGVGDVDRDGVLDLIVGAPVFNSNRSGYARVFSGKDGRVIYRLLGGALGDRFGFSVSGAGDVNGDGFPDLVVGAPLRNSSTGRVTVFSGKDGKLLHTFDGDARNVFFGYSVSGAGDVNGDGFADVIVGAPYHDSSMKDVGLARVFSGKDGKVLHEFEGQQAQMLLGNAVAAAGDVNRDGHADLLVGAHLFGADSGSATLFSGKDGKILLVFMGDSGDFLGSSVGPAGDVDGDGVPDLLVGAPQSTNASQAGFLRVFSGKTGKTLLTMRGDGSGDGFGSSAVATPAGTPGCVQFLAGAPADDNNGRKDSGSARLLLFCRATYEAVGRGCMGSNRKIPGLRNTGLPRLGHLLVLSASNVRPLSPGVLLTSSTPANFDLTPFGAPGCIAHANAHITLPFLTDFNGDAFFRFLFPRDPSMLGASFFNQLFLVDARANRLGVITSNGARARIGN